MQLWANRRYDKVVEWMLKNYDYARAQVLLRALGGNQGEGPYIVSFREPYSWDWPKAPPSRLYQDQSGIPLRLVDLWVKEFLNQAAQETFSRGTPRMLALKLRTTMERLTLALGLSGENMDSKISWIP
jgi:hypothetical protein